nr:membrane protein [Candidatus Pantoea persica]
MMSKALPGWRNYLFNSTWRYLLRIFLALTGSADVCAIC